MTGHIDGARTGWRDWSCSVMVSVRDPRALPVAERTVRELMHEVEHAVSRFVDDSDLVRVNETAGWIVPVGRLTMSLLERAFDAYDATDGLVDPTIGRQVRLAGYDRDIDQVRGRRAAVREQAGPAVGVTAVRLHPRLGCIGVPRGVELDLGATAKAWTADEAARRVHAATGSAVLVGIGGDVACSGVTRRPWLLDVAETESGRVVEQVSLLHGGLATSSTVGRAWVGHDGAPAHHIIDPRTGRPAHGPWRTATVWAETALAANTLSTAALLWGADAPRRLGARSRLAARLVGTDGRVQLVGDWPTDEAIAS